MRILKENWKTNKTAKFICERCGCEFECDEDEYWIDTSMTLTSCPAQYYAYANCPKCHKICHTFTHNNSNYEYVVTCKSDSYASTTSEPITVTGCAQAACSSGENK